MEQRRYFRQVGCRTQLSRHAASWMILLPAESRCEMPRAALPKASRLVRPKSGLTWPVKQVCPPGTASSAVSRRDLAGLCVALPGLPQALNTTIAVSGTGGEVQGLRDWGALLQLYKAKAAS